MWPRILILLNAYCAIQNPVNPQHIQRYTSKTRAMHGLIFYYLNTHQPIYVVVGVVVVETSFKNNDGIACCLPFESARRAQNMM